MPTVFLNPTRATGVYPIKHYHSSINKMKMKRKKISAPVFLFAAALLTVGSLTSCYRTGHMASKNYQEKDKQQITASVLELDRSSEEATESL